MQTLFYARVTDPAHALRLGLDQVDETANGAVRIRALPLTPDKLV